MSEVATPAEIEERLRAHLVEPGPVIAELAGGEHVQGAIGEALDALAGDSNDAEHDALGSILSALGMDELVTRAHRLEEESW